MKDVKIARNIMVYVGKSWIECYTTNGTLSDSCLVDVLRAWLLDWNKAYFVYFLLAETVFISSVNEMCGECVETFVKEIIFRANSS